MVYYVMLCYGILCYVMYNNSYQQKRDYRLAVGTIRTSANIIQSRTTRLTHVDVNCSLAQDDRRNILEGITFVPDRAAISA
jgi:hypothetical protein